MLITVFAVITFLFVVATLLPIWRFEHWLVRSLDFPRLQFSIGLLILLLLECLLLDWSRATTHWVFWPAVPCLAYQAWWIVRFLPLFRKEVQWVSKPDQKQSLRILSANVLTPNRNSKALLAHVKQYQPDILLTLESDDWWQQQLDAGLSADYPYSVKCPLENLYGMHVYSRLKLSGAQVKFLVEKDVPSIHAFVELSSGQKVRSYFLHPAPPSPTQNTASIERDAELVIVAKEVAKKDRPVIVAGDLNDVAWSTTTRLFRKISGLLDPRIGRGMFNTFHAKYWYLRWPLDQLFHSYHFGLARIQRLADIDSDHFPLLIDLVYLGNDGDDQNGIEADKEDRALAQEKLRLKDADLEDLLDREKD